MIVTLITHDTPHTQKDTEMGGVSGYYRINGWKEEQRMWKKEARPGKIRYAKGSATSFKIFGQSFSLKTSIVQTCRNF